MAEVKNQISKLTPWVVCLIAALFYCYEFLLRVIPSVMIEDLRQVFFLNGSQVGILLSMYSWSYTPMQLPSGPLMDYYGPRKLLIASIIMCCLGCFFIPVVVNLYVTQFSLFIIGLGSSFAFVGVLKLATNWLDIEYFSLVSGIATTLGMLGAVFGQSVMHVTITQFGWRDSWLVSGALGIVILILAVVFIHDCPRSKRNLKPKSGHPNFAQPFKEFYALVATTPQFIINGAIGGLIFTPISVLGSQWGVDFLSSMFNYTYDVSSNSMPLVFIGMAVGAPLAGWIVSYLDKVRLLLQISIVSILTLMLILMYCPHLTLVEVRVTLFMLGFFVGPQVLVFQNGVHLAPKNLGASAAAGTNFMVMIPAATFPYIIGRVLDYKVRGFTMFGDLVNFTRSDFQAAMLILPLSCAVALILSFFLKDITMYEHSK